MLLKAAHALIAWSGIEPPGGPLPGRAPPGAVAIGPLRSDDSPADWSASYEYTGGAAYTARRDLPAGEQRRHVMLDWYKLVYQHGVHPYAAHRAFLTIAEYQAIIKEHGMGPAQDEPGHDPNVPYGRACCYPVPDLRIFERHGALHVWPTSEA